MGLEVSWTGIRSFMATETRVQLHEWLAVVTGSLVQAALLVFVWVWAPGLLSFAVIGALSYSFFLVGQRVLNEAAYIRVDHKLNELYHASPLSPESYFLGMSLGILIAYLPPILLLFAFLEILHPLDAFALLTLTAAFLAVWAFSSAMGYCVSTLFRDMKTIWPYSSLLTNLFGIVPPVFYPLSYFQASLRPLALLIPTSSSVALVEKVAGMAALAPTEFLLGAVSLAVEAVAFMCFGVYIARRSARED
jgi:ABC-2 type transport system permease protein